MNQTPYINRTIVVFDDKLKQAVSDLIQENPKHCITDLSCSNLGRLEEAQHVIREYFKSNRDKLTLTGKGAFHYPDYYALLMAVIADLNVCFSWDNVFNQIPRGDDNTLELYQELPERDITYCTCAHWCLNVNTALILNPHTRLKLSLGSCCIEKTKITTKYQFRKMCLLNQVYCKKIEERKETLQRKKNKQCPPTPYEPCVRICIDCPKTIYKYDPLWKIRCIGCYKKFTSPHS